MSEILLELLVQHDKRFVSPVFVLCDFVVVEREREPPGGLWKRLLTLLSGVLKKVVAIELYSPSAQNNCSERTQNSNSVFVFTCV